MDKLFADLVITGSHIITVNQKSETAEAVAVLSDKIIAVGKADEIVPLIGDTTEVIRLNGQTVLPGFIEPHTHFMMYGIWTSWINAKTPPNENIPQLLSRIEKKVAETPKGEWITGYGLEEDALAEKRWPARDERDSVAPGNPLYIQHRSGHASVANNRALALAEITESTPQPEGGHMDRDPETDRLTGVR